MDILILNLLSESILDFGKWSNGKKHKYVYLCILRPKADLKRECPYFYSKFSLKVFGQYLKKSKNGFPIIFSKNDLIGVGFIF